MAEFTDQMNRTIRLESSPRRIVSLVPSQTQLLHFLGLEDEVVGITKFCVHPEEWFSLKERVGGTKTVDIEKVIALKPDLIIGNKEENSKSDIDALEAIAPVWMSDVNSLDPALEMINLVGDLVSKDTSELQSEISCGFDGLSGIIENRTPKSVLYFIWNEPRMVAGKGTFIDDMLLKCGLVNASNFDRYPEVDPELSPELIFLSSEPFPFNDKHVLDFQRAYPNSKIILVDGEMFSWYGSKLKDAPRYFIKLLEDL